MERAGRAGEARDDLVDAGDVVARAQGGDEGAWSALVDRHLGLVHAVCCGHGLHDDAAAEVNELVWLQLVEHLARIRTPGAVGGWVAATARSLCLAPERAGRRSGYVTAAVGGPAPAAPSGGTDRGTDGEGARLAAAFARIGARCQRLLRLIAIRPRPPDADISAGLDLAVADVEPACVGCLDRLRRLAGDVPDVLAGLRRAFAAADAVPGAWCEAARSAYAWHMLDAVPADRVYDTTVVVGRDGAGGARGAFGAGFAPLPPPGPAVRRLRFSTPHEDVELVVDSDGDEVLVVGRLASGRAADVTARWPGGRRTTRTRDPGAFRFQGLPVAPLSLHVAGEGGLKTGWILPTH